MPDASRWPLVKELFQAALDRPPAERAAFLDQACPDADLRAEVQSLLASHDQAGAFMEAPVTAPGARAEATLAPGTRLGPYAITAAVGSGGMGEVYRARDERLGREVAVKVLPRDLAADPGRRRRFEQEARAASALNHPNIVAVYDARCDDEVPFMVTELLHGQALDAWLQQGPLPVRKALDCALQAARGLSAAHERGIVHRDLKPANLFLTSEGQLKILDFGIAKLSPALEGAATGRREPATTSGVVLGTVGYMSPEQVRGARVDFRSDQFSLGCVLYELLAGEPPFLRPSAAQTMAAVLQDEPPPLAEVNPRVPLPVAWVAERCLAKDPDERYGSTRDLARDLELAQARLTELTRPVAASRARPRAQLLAAAAGGLALLAAAAALGRWARPAPATVPSLRYLTYSGRDTSPAASPDGKTIAFSSTRGGPRRIWIKQLATGSEVPLTAGDDDDPRFSPDGAHILFSRREGGRVSLYRVPAVGGEPRKLVDDALYGDYSPDGSRLAFVRQLAEHGGITSVIAVAGADGAGARELARLDGSRYAAGAFVHPRWSPDGRVLAATQSSLQMGEPTSIAVVDTGTGAVTRLEAAGGTGVWRGALVWTGQDEVVCAQPESVVGQQTGTGARLVRLELSSGRLRPLLWSPINIVGLDGAGRGRLVLAVRMLRQNLREVPLRNAGAAPARWLMRGNAADRQPVYARDGEWIAFSSNRSGNLDIWSVSRRTAATRRLTDDPAHDSDPAFMPDGRLLWSSNRSGVFEVWLAEADGSGARQVTRDGVDAENPVATPDGGWIVYASANPRSRGIMKVRPDGGEPTLVVGGNLIEPEVSPDGRFVAYVADSGSDRAALRVAHLAGGAALPFEVRLPPWSPGGTIDQGRCRWLPDGRALAYVAQDQEGRYSVFVQEFAPGGAAGRPRRLASDPDLDAESLGVSRDGALLTVSFREQLFDLMLADDVPGVEPSPRRRAF